jgi:hypothetical protein
MRFDEAKKGKILSRLQLDVDLLRKHELMDYSLLLAVTAEKDGLAGKFEHFEDAGVDVMNHEQYKAELDRLREKYKGCRNAFVSPRLYVYHIGIIDYLQTFDFAKKLENRFKRFKYGKKKMEQVSAIEPEPYGRRFMGFIRKEILGIAEAQ